MTIEIRVTVNGKDNGVELTQKVVGKKISEIELEAAAHICKSVAQAYVDIEKLESIKCDLIGGVDDKEVL